MSARLVRWLGMSRPILWLGPAAVGVGYAVYAALLTHWLDAFNSAFMAYLLVLLWAYAAELKAAKS
jgi:hypothetical protein